MFLPNYGKRKIRPGEQLNLAVTLVHSDFGDTIVELVLEDTVVQV